MAWSESLEGARGDLMLNMGSTATGQVRTSAQSIGTLNPANWDNEKIGAIASAMSRVLTKSIYEIRGTKTYKLLQG